MPRQHLIVSRRGAGPMGALALAAILLGVSHPATAQGRGRGPIHVPGQYILLFRDDVADPAGAADQLARQHGLALGHIYTVGVKGFSAAIPESRLAAVARDPRVRHVEPDQLVTVDQKSQNAKGGGGSSTQVIPTGVRRIHAPASLTARIDGKDERVNVDVAIVDTGIQTDHPDLNVGGGVNYASGKAYTDGHGHGTHVAGTVGALDNGIGVVGVAPGARLWAVRVLDNSGSGLLSWIIAGVNWVTANAATIKVANMSLGFNGSSPALNQAIASSVAAGVTYVVAAGNDAADAATFSPANHPDVICVSAVADSDGLCGKLGPATPYGADDSFASFSNYGLVVDIAAPGVSILSTYKGSSYATLSGTSMASPHVAGAAALYLAGHAGATPATVREEIIKAASLADSGCGYSGAPADGLVEKLVNVAGF
jgi:subtilisin